MVYRGKPSGACAACRQRKTKCGREAPACSQCIRGGRICPGYRDTLDLMFLDQTKDIEIKSQERVAWKAPGTSTDSGESSRVGSPRAHTVEIDLYKLPKPSYTLPPSLDDHALAWVFQNFVVPQSRKDHGNLHHLLVLNKGDTISNALLFSLIAVGTAGMARTGFSPALQDTARRKYVEGVVSVNAALRDPAKVKQDETLAAILLLGYFELIVCDSVMSLQAWRAHMKGALALIQVRGERQFRRETGQYLFWHLRSSIVAGCLSRGEYVPPEIQHWAAIARKYPNVEEEIYAKDLVDILVQICSIRARSLRVAIVETEMIDEALNIDNELVEWTSNLPPKMGVKMVDVPHPAEATCEGYGLVYYDNRCSAMWNYFRWGRLTLHQLIADALDPKKPTNISENRPSLSDQYDKSSEIANIMTSDILASAYFHLELHGNSSIIRIIDGLLPCFQLYVAAEHLLTNGGLEARPRVEWTVRRLDYIGSSLGMQMASKLADALRWRLSMTFPVEAHPSAELQEDEETIIDTASRLLINSD